MSRPCMPVMVLLVTCALAPGGPAVFAQAPAVVNADAKTLAAFQERVRRFVEIHKKAEATLPRLPQEATPEQIDRNQRDLGRLIREARAAAKQGDIFGPDMHVFVGRLMARLFANPGGAQLRASIMDENPQGIVVRVNDRYPDDVPLSTMPPQVLETLPKMPEEMEYRFVGAHFVILDSHAHLIADFLPAVLQAVK